MARHSRKPTKKTSKDKSGDDNAKHRLSLDQVLIRLADDDPLVRQDAQEELAAQGPTVIDELGSHLRSSEPRVRQEIVKALAEIGGVKSTNLLVTAVGDEDLRTRQTAIEGLLQMGQEMLPALLRGLKSSSNSIWMRQGTISILHALVDEQNYGIAQPVLEALEEDVSSLSVPVAADEALALLEKAHGR